MAAHALGFSSGTLRLSGAAEPQDARCELELVMDAPPDAEGERSAVLEARVLESVRLEQGGMPLAARLTVLALGHGGQAEDIVRLRVPVTPGVPLVLSTETSFGDLVLSVYRPGEETVQRELLAGGHSLTLDWNRTQAEDEAKPSGASQVPVRAGATSDGDVAPLSSLVSAEPTSTREAKRAVSPDGETTSSEHSSLSLAFEEAVESGFWHILPLGLDHVAFVLGLLLVSTGLWSLSLDLSVFTLAHSVTLALGALGLVRVSPTVAEPLIALSIAAIALEPRWRSWLLGLGRNRVTVDRIKRLVVFGFGLIHGLGFAFAFGGKVDPGWQFAKVLLGFNLGVELGQVAVVCGALLVLTPAQRYSWFSSRLVPWASAVIAALGLFWFFERLLG